MLLHGLVVLRGGVVCRGSHPAPALPFLFAVWVVGSVLGLLPRSCPCLRFGTVGCGLWAVCWGSHPAPALPFILALRAVGYRQCVRVLAPLLPLPLFLHCGQQAVCRGSRLAPAPAFVSALWVAGCGQCVGILAPLLPCLLFWHCMLWAIDSVSGFSPCSCPCLCFGTMGCRLWAVRWGTHPAPALSFIFALQAVGCGQCRGSCPARALATAVHH